MLYAVNPTDGSKVDSLKSPGYWPTGLTCDGKHLWNADRTSGKIYRISLAGRTIDRVIDAPGRTPVGLTWDGSSLWVSDDSSDRIYQVSPLDGTTITSLESPWKGPRGLGWDGRYLWATDREADEIYLIDPVKGWVIMILDAPGEYSWGLCWVDGKLFNADMADDAIYQVTPIDRQWMKTEGLRKAEINFFHQVRVDGPDPLLELNVYLAVPADRPNQTIVGDVAYSPQPFEIVNDSWGQSVAHFRYVGIQPGSAVSTTMSFKANVGALRYFIHPDRVTGLDRIPDNLKPYLGDGEKYRIDDPVITGAVMEAVGDEHNPYWIARRIYEYVMEHMYYELTGGWNVAPAVLQRGNGSCSEYSFVLISMLRAAGIPARYVGSVVVRGDDVSFDDVFHRWVEFYLPGYGWIPADASRGDKKTPRERAGSFGSISNRVFITTESGGGSEYLGWTYNSKREPENTKDDARCPSRRPPTGYPVSMRNRITGGKSEERKNRADRRNVGPGQPVSRYGDPVPSDHRVCEESLRTPGQCSTDHSRYNESRQTWSIWKRGGSHTGCRQDCTGWSHVYRCANSSPAHAPGS